MKRWSAEPTRCFPVEFTGAEVSLQPHYFHLSLLRFPRVTCPRPHSPQPSRHAGALLLLQSLVLRILPKTRCFFCALLVLKEVDKTKRQQPLSTTTLKICSTGNRPENLFSAMVQYANKIYIHGNYRSKRDTRLWQHRTLPAFIIYAHSSGTPALFVSHE